MGSRGASDGNGPRHFSEDDVADILRRAAAIDARAGREATEANLREIAREVGISSGAISRAIAEHDGARTVQASRPRLGRSADWLRPLLAATAGAAAGVVARMLDANAGLSDPNATTVNVAIAVGAGSLGLSMIRRSGDALGSFVRANAALWGGFVAGWSAVHGDVWGDLVFVGVTGFLATSCVGALGILWKQVRSQGAGLEAETVAGRARES